jgi:ABC-type uncharacterized transport system substrate-binding protein
MSTHLRRREFITLLSGAAAWPQAARAQQKMPVIGLLMSYSLDQAGRRFVAAFRDGLKESGYEEGRNVAIEYRSADGHYDRLPALAAELVRLPSSVIAAVGGSPAAQAAKRITTTIPIVFQTGVDPVQLGLVASLSRPGGNVTGIASLSYELGPKRVELLREPLVPAASLIGLLINPNNPVASKVSEEAQTAARKLGLRIHVLHATTEHDFETAFTALGQLRVSGLVIGGDPFFNSRGAQLARLALRHKLPAVYQFREFVVAGGLASYGSSISETHRLTGVYTGRVLKGEKPSELPVQLSTKVELIVNLKTAKTIGVEVPTSLLLRADEVIE